MMQAPDDTPEPRMSLAPVGCPIMVELSGRKCAALVTEPEDKDGVVGAVVFDARSRQPVHKVGIKHSYNGGSMTWRHIS